MRNLELTAEDKMRLYDLIESDTWKIVRRISDYHYRQCLDSLLAMSDQGDFRHTQGMAHGWRYLVDAIENAAKPPNPIFNDTYVSEAALNARKK